MSNIDVNQLMAQMRVMSSGQAQSSEAAQPEQGGNAVQDFAALLKDSIDNVNQTQKTASGLAEAFERGDQSADLGEVMVALQKANVSFQAMTQVRNKLVEAYKDVMNMPI